MMSAFVIGVVVAVLVVGFFATARRFRRGGPGPRVNYVPRPMRGKVDREFEKNG